MADLKVGHDEIENFFQLPGEEFSTYHMAKARMDYIPKANLGKFGRSTSSDIALRRTNSKTKQVTARLLEAVVNNRGAPHEYIVAIHIHAHAPHLVGQDFAHFDRNVVNGSELPIW